ncbi:MAG: serine/threonine-protein kinase [Verrucomicrobiota bacterium]
MNESGERAVGLFSAALSLSAAERGAYLARACGADVALRAQVEALLRAHEEAGEFLQAAPADAPSRSELPAVQGVQAGERIGRYKLLQQIGEGGWGVVFMAEQEQPVRRMVALKVIKPGMDTKNVIARFEAERQALALMDHPNIAKVLDAGATEAGRPYFVMELVRGTKITDYCDQQALSTPNRLELFVQVCHAVQHAHQKGIIHRDLKPSNILVTTGVDGAPVPQVIDFGIAKATTGQRLTDKTVFTAFELLIGTPAYMSPEQAAMTNVDVDTRTDIYSLGVLLYELLTGTTPFDTGKLWQAGLDEVRRVILNQEPMRPSTRLGTMGVADLTTVAQRRQVEAPKLIRAVRGDLDWIVIKALEKDRTRRYETANGLALDVKRFLANETITARPPGQFYKIQKLVLRNKAFFGGVSVIALLLVVGLIVVSAALAKERQTRREADSARQQAESDKLKAETAAAKSQQVTRFLEDMLQGVGPSVALGRDATMLREVLERTAVCVGLELTNQPAVEAELRSVIGRVYAEIGNYDRAEEMHRAALKIYQLHSGSESLDAATALSNLGEALWKQRKLNESEQVHLVALDIRRRISGVTNAGVAASLNSLAGVSRRQHRLKESEDLARQALAIRQKVFGVESLEAAETLHNLCIVLGDEGQRAEAETVAREMLAIRRKLLGNEHPLVAAALADLAWIVTGAGKLQEAVATDTEALVLQRKLLGDEHPEVAKSLVLLAQLLQRQGSKTEARAVLKTALSIQQKILGPDHNDALETLRVLGWLLEKDGEFAEAEVAYRAALDLRRKRGDRDLPQLLPEVEDFLRVLVAQNKLSEAERELAATLTPEVVRLPESANLLVLQTDLLGRQGRWLEAVSSATMALEHQPAEHYRYHTLAGLLAVTERRSAYTQLCARILTTFTNTTNPYIAERMSKDCLLRPEPGVDWASAARLADKSVLPPNGDAAMPYFQVAKALAEYRLGNFVEATNWAQKALNHPEVYSQSHASAVLAMAYWQLGQWDEARALLVKGKSLAEALKPGRDPEKIGGAWVAWLFSQIQLNEAAALIESTPAPDSLPKQP